LINAILWTAVVGDMPVALVEKGTTPEQKVHTTTLTKLPDLVASETIHAIQYQ
jgi:uroporphyrin-III C-methyltransferase/precorrin-2 dehydrogenase/sirohydrochlorin ferrochelatase